MRIRILMLCALAHTGYTQTLAFREKYEEPTTEVANSLPEPTLAIAAQPAATQSWVRLAGRAETDGRVRLRWHTNPKQAKQTFLVERATDDGVWVQLSQVNGADTIAHQNAYEFTDNHPVKSSNYRLFCLNADGSHTHSPVLTMVNPRRANQPIAYFAVSATTVQVGLEATQLILPLTANVYTVGGKLLCYDTLTSTADEFTLDVPATSDESVKVQVVDGTHRVLATRLITLPK